MRGMLWMDGKRLRWWLLFGVLWTTGATFSTYALELRSSPVSILIYLLFPIYAMAFVKGQVLSDVESGWLCQVATLNHGRRTYAMEKYLLLLCFLPILAIGGCVGTLLYDYGKYGEWMLGANVLHFVSWKKLLVFFCGFSALLMPVLLLSPKRYTKWETILWAIALPLALCLYEMDAFAYHAARLQNDMLSPQAFRTENHIFRYALPWELLCWIAILLFVGTGIVTIWKIEKQTSMTERKMGMQKRGRQWAILGLILTISLTIVWAVDSYTPKSFLYVYSKPNGKGTTSYLLTHKTPEELAEKAEFADYTYKTHYEAQDYVVHTAGMTGEKLLLWDDQWLLWDIETHESEALSIPYAPYTDDEIHYSVWAIDSAEPMAAFVRKSSDTFIGFAFFSIPEDRMITDFAYCDTKDELIDGKIAAKTKEEVWVLLDPYTGDVVETLAEEPMED